MTEDADLRRMLHRRPEVSGQEKNTSETIRSVLAALHPDEIVTGIGGHGLAAVYAGEVEGPRVLVRCELDALPIPETLDIPHRSKSQGVSHKCGHDGHMTMLVGLAERLCAKRPARGSVVLLYQPAEETGEGAQRVLRDPKCDAICPDYVLALHNLPGYALGQVVVREGVFASASSGLRIHLQGDTSHAAEPEAGRSPALAVAQLIQTLSAIPQFYTPLHESAQATVIHARLGEVAFGTSPGEADVMVTLRSHAQDIIDLLADRAIAISNRTAEMYGLGCATDLVEPFPATINDAGVVRLVTDVAQRAGLSVHQQDIPFAWSEDFGHFTSQYRGALFGLGAGRDQPALHHPDYDFPDDLTRPGTNLLEAIVRRLLDDAHV
jgi:amidohydrolase